MKTLIILLFFISMTSLRAQPLIINHLNTNIDLIPDSVITDIKENYRIIHGHLSHGWQIDDGLDSLEVNYPDLKAEIGNYSLPHVNDALNIMYYYASDESYWYKSGAAILREYLNSNPDINVALFSWCRDLDENDAVYVQAYLDTLLKLEQEFPQVSFIYATGNAQKSGEVGLLRFNNNTKIRDYCENNGKFLYDFGDLDCWWFNPATQSWEDSSYTINNTEVPIEHTRFHQELWHHTTVESGIQKAKALWWLLARLSGWLGPTVGDSPVAMNDTATVEEDMEVTIHVLENDYAPGSVVDPSSVKITWNPSHGTITSINSQNGRITYKPKLNYTGSDFFLYTIKNLENEISNPAQVHLQISPVNDAPQNFNLIQPAQNDTVYADEEALHFIWQRSEDVDNASLNYELHIFTADNDTLITELSDTSMVFDGRAFWREGSAYQWMVRASDGQFTVASADTFLFYVPFSDIIEPPDKGLPGRYTLLQNYPNPFNPSTSIQFSMPEAGRVVLTVLDVRGQVIDKIMDDYKMAGPHRVFYHAGHLASGLYFYQIRIGKTFSRTRKMMLLR